MNVRYVCGLFMFMQVAVLHNDLATALEMAGEYVEAEKHVAESLEVADSVGGANISEHLATFYYNLGTILSRQGTIISSQFTVLSEYVYSAVVSLPGYVNAVWE